MTKRPTLTDVAHLAQVAPSTASLAFSTGGSIKPATKQRILQAAAELDYRGPNPMGRNLRQQSSGVVALVIGATLQHHFRDPVARAVLDGLSERLATHDLGVLLIPQIHDPKTGKRVPGLQPLSRAAYDVAVLIGCTREHRSVLSHLRDRGIPLIGLEGPDFEDIHQLNVADEEGFARLAHELLQLGHRRIATVTLPFQDERRFHVHRREDVTLADIPVGATRRRIAALDNSGIRPSAIIETTGSRIDQGKAAAQELLNQDEPPTAIMAQSDVLAGGVVLAAEEMGFRVPHDVTVTGFDGVDIPWLGDHQLTTVSQPLREKGLAAGDLILQALEGKTTTVQQLPTHLRWGTTSGPVNPQV